MIGVKNYTINFADKVFRRWYLLLLIVGATQALWLIKITTIPAGNLAIIGFSYLYLHILLLLNETTTYKNINAPYLMSVPLVVSYLTFGIAGALAMIFLGQILAIVYIAIFIQLQGMTSHLKQRHLIRRKVLINIVSTIAGLLIGATSYTLLKNYTEISDVTALFVLALVTASSRALIGNLLNCPNCPRQHQLVDIGWRATLDGLLTIFALLLPLAVTNNNAFMFGGILAILVAAALAVRAIRVVYLALTGTVEELEVLDRLSKTLIDVGSKNKMYQVTYELVAQLMETPVFFVAEPVLPVEQEGDDTAPSGPLGFRFSFVMQDGKRTSWPDQRWTPDSLVVQTMQYGSQLVEDCTAAPPGQLPVDCRSFLGVSILYQENSPGVMGVLHPAERNVYETNDQRLLETIAAQIAIVSRANRLRQQAQHFTDGLVAVNHVANVINASLEQSSIFEEICARAQELTGACCSVVFLKSGVNQYFEPAYNSGVLENVLQEMADAMVMHDDDWREWLSRMGAKVVVNFETDEQVPWLAPIMMEGDIAALILTPFIAMHSLLEGDNLSPDRDLLGFQIVFFSEPHIPPENTLNLLQMLANHSAIALENVGLFAETQLTLRRLIYLEEATRVFTESLELSSTTQSIVEWIVMALELDSVTLALWEPSELALTVHAHAQKSAEAAFSQERPAFDLPLEQLPEIALTLENRWSQLYAVDNPELSPALRAIFTEMEFASLLITPLVLRNEVMGILALGRHDSRPITANDINVAEAIASQAAAAIQNAQFYAFTETELTARVTEISVLENVLRNISASADEQAIIKDVLEAAAIVTRADMMGCALVRSQNTLQLYWTTHDRAGQLIQHEYPDANRGVIGHVLRTKESQIITDTSEAPHYWKPDGFENYRSELCVPIMHQGEALGILNLESSKIGRFNFGHQRFMQNLAGHAAIALVRADLLSNNRRQIAILDTLRSLSIELLDTTDLKALLHKVCLVAMNITRAINIQVYFYDEATDTVTFYAGLNDDGRRDVEIRAPRPDGLTYQAIRAEKPVLSDNFQQIPGYPTRRLGIFPLKHQERVIGTLNVAVADHAHLDKDEIRALELLANQTASAVTRAHLFTERQHQIELSDKLRQLSVAMLNAVNMTDLVHIICDGALALVKANEVHLYFYDSATQKLTFAANLWRDGTRNQEVPLNPGGITQNTVEAGEVVVRANKYPPSREGYEARIVAGIPLKYGTELIGVIGMSASDPAFFREAELQALELFANQSAPAIINMWYYEAIRKGRDQMQVVLNTVRDGLVLVDQEGKVMQANPAADHLIGIEIAAYQGEHLLRILHRAAQAQNLKKDDFRHPEQTKALWRELEENIYQITRRSVSRETATGTIHLEEESAPVLAENGKPIGRLFVWHDVTEARQMAEARDELTNTIIHDLRSPLASIKSGLHMLPEILTEPDALNQSLQVVEMAENSADGLLNLVSGLLDVARLESGKVPLNRYPTEFSYPLTEAMQTLHVLAQEQGVILEIDMPDSLPPVNIDSEKIRRVLINLVDNALHYTPAGKSVLITAEKDPESDYLLITVDDSGPGIPPDKRNEIFDRFITGVTGGGTKHKGLGLGLAFCKLAIEAHDGTIWVEDGLNGGAAFRFTLPIIS